MRRPVSNIVSGLAETTVANILATISGVATGMMASRLLGPEQRGLLAAMQNWAGLLYGFGALGLTTAAGYYSGRRQEDSGRLFSTTLFVLLVWSVPLLGIAFVLMPVLLPGQSPYTIQQARLYLLMVPVQFGIGVSFSVLQGLRRFRLWNVLRLLGPAAWMMTLLISWMVSFRTASPVLDIYMFLMFVVAVIFMLFGWKYVERPRGIQPAMIPGLFRYGLPTVMTSVPQVLNLRLDQLMMAAMLPPKYLGEYVVAVAWSGSLGALLTSVAQVLFPTLAGIRDERTRNASLGRALRLSAALSAVLSLVVLPLTSVCIPLFYGESFRPAVQAAELLVVAGGIAAFNQVAGEGARGIGAVRVPLLAEGVGLLMTVVLLWALLKRYQMMGAATASLLSYLATAFTLVTLLARRTESKTTSLLLLNAGDIIYVRDMVSSVSLRLKDRLGPTQAAG